MNIANVPDEFCAILDGSAFDLNWYAPGIDQLLSLLFEREYTSIQQLILQSLLTIYQAIRGVAEKHLAIGTISPKNMDVLRKLANCILNYGAATADSGHEKQFLSILLGKIQYPVQSLVSDDVYSKTPLSAIPCNYNVFGISGDSLTIDDSMMVDSDNSVKLQEVRSRIANLEQILDPTPATSSISQRVLSIMNYLVALRRIRISELRSVSAIPASEFEFIKKPILFLVYHRQLVSIRQEPRAGAYLRCVTLLPGQTITYRIEKSMRTELTKELTSSVVDSNSSEAQNSLMDELQSVDKSQVNTAREQNDYFREQTHLDTGLKVNLDYGKNNFSLDKLISNIGLNIDTEVNWSNDKEFAQEINSAVNTEASIEKIAKSVGNQVSKVNTAKQLTITEKTTQTTVTEEKNFTEITMTNPSKIYPIQIQTYQAVCPYAVYTVVTGLSFYASNGISQITIPFRNIAKLSSIIPKIYPNFESAMNEFTITTINDTKVKVMSDGFKDPDKTIEGFVMGLPIMKANYELNMNGLIDVIKVLDVKVLDSVSVDTMVLNNERIKMETAIYSGVAAVITKIADGVLEIQELGKILFAMKGKEPISSVQYLKLDSDSERKVL